MFFQESSATYKTLHIVACFQDPCKVMAHYTDALRGLPVI